MNKQVTSDTKITFQYYDRGIYDTQHWKWRVGCLQGDPSFHELVTELGAGHTEASNPPLVEIIFELIRSTSRLLSNELLF